MYTWKVGPLASRVNTNLKELASLFIRNMEAVEKIEEFILSATVAVISIRIILKVFDYPQIGKGDYHIAHMLWGGLLMMIALITTIVFLNKEAKSIGAYVGGFGFGTFIDEIGKLITRDNNYFFKPSYVLIYFIFVTIFLAVKYLFRMTNITKAEYAINAMEILKEIVIDNLEVDEKEKAMLYLQNSEHKNPLVGALIAALDKIAATSFKKNITLAGKIKEFLKSFYLTINRDKKTFSPVDKFFITVSSISFIVSAIEFYRYLDFWHIGLFLSSLLTILLVFYGVYLHMKKITLAAYITFQKATIISILLVAFFMFYINQIIAFCELAVFFVNYIGLNYLIKQEKLTSGNFA